jgi:hypothetical protein
MKMGRNPYYIPMGPIFYSVRHYGDVHNLFQFLKKYQFWVQNTKELAFDFTKRTFVHGENNMKIRISST